MDFVIRQFKFENWRDQIRDATLEGINAEPITTSTCLKARNNVLSFWKCRDIEDGVIVIASCHRKYESVDVILISKDELKQKAINFRTTPESGDSPILSYNSCHVDLYDLTLRDIGELAKILADKLLKQKDYKTFLPQEIVQIMADRIQADDFEIEELNEPYHSKVKQVLQQISGK